MGHFEKGAWVLDNDDKTTEIHKFLNTAGGFFGHNHKYSDEDIVNKMYEIIRRVNDNTHEIEKIKQQLSNP